MNRNHVNDYRSTSPFILCYILIVMCCYMLPVLKYSISYVPLAILLLLTYVFCIHQTRIDMDPYGYIIISAAILGLLTIVVCQPLNLTEGANEAVRALRFVAPAILFLFLEGNGKPNKRYLYAIIAVALLLFIFVGIQTMRAVQTNALIARILAYGSGISDELAAYRYQNVGGFEFSYAFGFIAVVSLYMVMAVKKAIFKILWAILYGFSIFYVIQVQYMTLLILVVVFSIIILFRASGNSFVVLLLSIPVAILIVMLPSLMSYLSENSNLSMLSYKFSNFSSFFSDGDLADLGNRPRYLWEAFLRFLSSPIWGNKIVSDGTIMEEYNEVHSTFFGYLQNMGMIGWICFYVPIIMMTKRIKNTLRNHKSRAVYGTIVAMFITLSILNPVNYAFEISFTVFLIVPCILRLLDELNDTVDDSEDSIQEKTLEQDGSRSDEKDMEVDL